MRGGVHVVSTTVIVTEALGDVGADGIEERRGRRCVVADDRDRLHWTTALLRN